MADCEKPLVQATDDLIALYRNIDRSTLDLPVVSLMPLVIYFWAVCRFLFFFYVGLILIVPVNLVILIRNLFPGRWRYRPFFLKYIYYCLVWIWRGEAPTAPFIFVRPLLTTYMKAHFERRIQRLRLEVLDSDLTDSTRSAVLVRIEAALERWKSPRFAAILLTIVLPAIIAIPGWYKQLTEFLGSFAIQVPTDTLIHAVSNTMSKESLVILAAVFPGYLIGIPITAFLAKRGLFLGLKSDSLYFPGGNGGAGLYYAKEREILDTVGLRVNEAPIDLWLYGFVLLLGAILQFGTHLGDLLTSAMQTHYEYLGQEFLEGQRRIQRITQTVVWILLSTAFVVSAVRRRKLERVPL
jgi:hypothetical protein